MAFTFGRKNKWVCSNCRRENYKDARFCEYCGSNKEVAIKISECESVSRKEADRIIICSECGYQNPMGVAFCQGCGLSMQKKNADDEVRHSEIIDFSNQIHAKDDDVAAPRRNVEVTGTERCKTILCPECGKANSFTMAFCESCGCRLSISREQTV